MPPTMNGPLLPIDFINVPRTPSPEQLRNPHGNSLFSRATKFFSGSARKTEGEGEGQAEELEVKKEKELGPRTLGVWAGDVHAQEQSAFLRLPAEIRNVIYEIVFTPEARDVEEAREEARVRAAMDEAVREEAREAKAEAEAKAEQEREMERAKEAGEDIVTTSPPASPKKKSKEQTPPPHPLALLLTCRKVSDDATLLAFGIHPHRVAAETTYHALRQRSLFLPPESLAAIKTLLFAFTSRYYYGACSDRHVADFLTNAALLSPTISTLIVRVTTRADDRTRPDGLVSEHFAQASCAAHIPSWFSDALRTMRAGRSYIWQTGEKWDVSYPSNQLHMEDWLHRSVWHSAMVCRGDCVALLHQEGSEREIMVKLQYVWDWEAVRRRQALGLNVRLVEGVERLDVQEVCGGTGLVWDPEERYWEELKARKEKEKRLFGGVVEAADMVWKGSIARFVLGKS